MFAGLRPPRRSREPLLLENPHDLGSPKWHELEYARGRDVTYQLMDQIGWAVRVMVALAVLSIGGNNGPEIWRMVAGG